MRSVTAREANQAFSKLLEAAAKGEEIVVTRRGKPVARICPIVDQQARDERDAAIERMSELMREGLDLGGNAWPGRGAIYER
jgi:prevent-host-death family protein